MNLGAHAARVKAGAIRLTEYFIKFIAALLGGLIILSVLLDIGCRVFDQYTAVVGPAIYSGKVRNKFGQRREVIRGKQWYFYLEIQGAEKYPFTVTVSEDVYEQVRPGMTIEKKTKDSEPALYHQ